MDSIANIEIWTKKIGTKKKKRRCTNEEI